MWRWALLLLFWTTGCGYKVVRWDSVHYKTLAIPPVIGSIQSENMKVRLRDAMIERCLAGSSLKPDRNGQLKLAVEISQYEEQVIATDTDGRTLRLQFAMKLSFKLTDEKGALLWSLKDYPYSDQYSVTTTQAQFKDEGVFVQDQAMRSIADLVITNINLTLSELEASP